MEIQRALVITGIAIVSYLMIQAWQQDYANPTQPAPVEEVAQSAQGNWSKKFIFSSVSR